ncbi:MAG: 2-C-methyl-D-erythritol 2,4-cyclodiphosphate synthase [Rickettsiales bacterium]
MSKKPTIVALIVAAGVGKRAGGVLPKQYALIAGKPLLRYSVEALGNHPAIAAVQVVIHPEHTALFDAAIHSHLSSRFAQQHRTRSVAERGEANPASEKRDPGATAGVTVEKILPPIHGGAERADSVRAGLEALAAYAPDYVLIHDAARPFLSAAMIDAIIEKLGADTAVLPALAVADTLRRFDGTTWSEVPRDQLLRIQTPQAFPFARLLSLTNPEPRTPHPELPTDDAATWLAAGGTLVYVQGSEDLRKVTTGADMVWAEQAAASRIAVGMGYDVHQLIPAGEAGVIRIGGIDIPHSHKLLGHSDADVLLHAITDALLGTIADGDIGMHFKPTDERWKGANSGMFLTEAGKRVRAAGGVIHHIDATVICELPKIGPHRDAMREMIATLLDVNMAQVSVKATTTEQLGFTGRGEGIACQAVATVALPALA